MPIDFTPHQKQAIDVANGNILVSAAAGSGKTAVLAERVMKMLTGDGTLLIMADRIIVVTFTVAAAEEMRKRIGERLAEKISSDPSNELLQTQQLLLNSAHISTIHSLCSFLIKENFQSLSLPESIKIAETSQLLILQDEAVREVFEAHFERDDSDFLSLLDFSYGKDDTKLFKMVLSIYNFIRSFAFPFKYLKEAQDKYELSQSIYESPWTDEVFSHIGDTFSYCASAMECAIKEMKREEDIYKKYSDCFFSEYNCYKTVCGFIENRRYETAAKYILSFDCGRLSSVKNPRNPTMVKDMKRVRDRTKKIFDDVVKKFLCFTNEDFVADNAILKKQVSILFAVVKEVYNLIEEKKLTQEILDYSDLEHYALKLLSNETQSGYEKSELGKTLSEQFDAIMIDECQDINEVQNLIFKLLSKEEKNIYMVGDVKQSIYSFREARPSLFVEKKKEFSPYDPKTHTEDTGAYITLEANFRSRKEVCDVVNFIFTQLMSEKLGDINYEKGEALVCAANYPASDDCSQEVHILSYDKESSNEKKVAVEARYIASLCKKMIASGFEVTEKSGEKRPCKYKDFAILLRKKKEIVKVFSKTLDDCGVPVASDNNEGYLEEYEIAVALNVLRIIDNPLLDIALLSVLFSPVFGLSPDDITKLRLSAGKKQPLYTALKEYSKTHETSKKVVTLFDELRVKASVLPVSELLREIYDKTDFVPIFSATTKNSADSERKSANLHLLLRYASEYENVGTGGLSGFLRYIDKVKENEQDLPSANVNIASANAVKIMSIHASKGLEFPICIVADCSKEFNRQDINTNSFQNHAQLGFSMKISEPASFKSYNSFSYEAIKLKREKDMLSEELRVLYVALTRAREKLICVMTFNKAEKKLFDIASTLTGDAISPYQAYSAKSYADWLLIALLRHRDFSPILEQIGKEGIKPIEADFNLSASFCVAENKIEAEEAFKEATSSNDNALQKRLEERFAEQYANKSLTSIRAKLTVTELAKKQQLTRVNLQEFPSFMSEKKATPTKRGTVLHKFMQYADFTMAQANLETELSRLLNQGFFSNEEIALLEKDKIQSFLQSALCKRILQNEHKREYKFNFFLPASEAYEEIEQKFADIQIFVQGIADCIIFEGDDIVLVDYKTDMLTDKQELVKRYENQMRLYKKAIEQTFLKKVKQCLIYSLNTSNEIEVL